MPKATSILKVKSSSPGMTGKLGERLGKKLFPGAVLALTGELGSGKTVLAQGILKGLGVKDKYKVSPSFVLVKEYKGRLPAYHLDLFRLRTKEEIISLGIKEYLFGDGVTIIEWAEKAKGILPEECLEIRFGFGPSQNRIISFFPNGKRYRDLLSHSKLSSSQ
jgi:tRNA threonylcarbamoyladenosine biosynthesis protein TsaE